MLAVSTCLLGLSPLSLWVVFVRARAVLVVFDACSEGAEERGLCAPLSACERRLGG